MKIITAENKHEWNRIVKSFEKWDIYYLNEYAVTFSHHGDGIPLLLYLEDGDERSCYVVMKRDVADDSRFHGMLDKGIYYDYETPYGYGGPLCDKPLTKSTGVKFLNEIKEHARSNSIVSQFVRFHPLISNHDHIPDLFETKYLHQTVFIDTDTPEKIFSNMDSKNRNMIRKAMKNGVTVEKKEIGEYKDFLLMYQETMTRDQASSYYFFSEDYFREQKELKDNALLFYALKDGSPISGAIIYYNDRFMHYHLAGSYPDARKYAAGNLLLYEAACAASSMGIKHFHLGGGMNENDSLFGFKKQFNKEGRLPFYIGRTIFDKDAYAYLLDLRKKEDHSFNKSNERMIQYRA